MELAANYMCERGIMITYTGWNKEARRYNRTFTMQQIVSINPDLGVLIASGKKPADAARVFSENLDVSDATALKAVKELRESGTTTIPTIRHEINAPEVRTLAPDGEWIFPSYTIDPQRAPFAFYRTYYTAQELIGKSETDGWDIRWVEHIIDTKSGIRPINSRSGERVTGENRAETAKELIEVVHCYQRLINREDRSEGIYLSVVHADFNGTDGIPGYAKFELQNGMEDYPVDVTKISEDNNRLYDVESIAKTLRGIQFIVKTERDSRADRNSLATIPPIMHPPGDAPSDWGPGRFIPYRRRGDIVQAPSPSYDPGSAEMERVQQDQADRLVGLDNGPLASVRRQFIVDKFLRHAAKVLRSAYRSFQRYGPDSVFFRVTGSPDPIELGKGDPDDDFDITIDFDVTDMNPETFEKKFQAFMTLLQFDRNAKINVDALIEFGGNAIDPVMADLILLPTEGASERLMGEVTNDLARIYAGIEMPARPNGAAKAIQIVDAYISQRQIQERMAENEAFSQALQKYRGQYEMILMQAQNRETGRIGTLPAQMGGMNTQNIANES
jgi:hypothetical protein